MMDGQEIPRIAKAKRDDSGPFRLRVTWMNGQESLVDLAAHIARFKLYRPIRDGQLPFDRVRIGEYGADLAWTDELDISADTVWRLTQEQHAGRIAHAAQ